MGLCRNPEAGFRGPILFELSTRLRGDNKNVTPVVRSFSNTALSSRVAGISGLEAGRGLLRVRRAPLGSWQLRVGGLTYTAPLQRRAIPFFSSLQSSERMGLRLLD